MHESYRNITLTDSRIEFQKSGRSWESLRLDDESKGIYQRILEDHKPSRKYDESKFSYEWSGARYRGQISHSAFKGWTVSLRKLTEEIPLFGELNIHADEIMSLIKPKGITLISGPLDNGKSTTLLAASGKMGAHERGKTLTIEDPIEYIYKDSFTYQREVGADVLSAEDAIRQALRENYRTVIIGEIRTPETMEAAVQAGLNGLRVLATIHGEGVVDTVEKVQGLLSDKWQRLLPRAISGIFSQVLVRPIHAEDNRIVPLYESLEMNTVCRSIIQAGSQKTMQLYQEMDHQGRDTMGQKAKRALRDGLLADEDVASYINM